MFTAANATLRARSTQMSHRARVGRSGKAAIRRAGGSRSAFWQIYTLFMANSLRSNLMESRPVRPRSASVEEDRLAGHEVGGRRGEVDRQRPDLLGLSHPAHRDVPRQALADPWVGEG